jgi:hypothetical protein
MPCAPPTAAPPPKHSGVNTYVVYPHGFSTTSPPAFRAAKALGSPSTLLFCAWGRVTDPNVFVNGGEVSWTAAGGGSVYGDPFPYGTDNTLWAIAFEGAIPTNTNLTLKINYDSGASTDTYQYFTLQAYDH